LRLKWMQCTQVLNADEISSVKYSQSQCIHVPSPGEDSTWIQPFLYATQKQ
jgi:hypothetical protein